MDRLVFIRLYGFERRSSEGQWFAENVDNTDLCGIEIAKAGRFAAAAFAQNHYRNCHLLFLLKFQWASQPELFGLVENLLGDDTPFTVSVGRVCAAERASVAADVLWVETDFDA